MNNLLKIASAILLILIVVLGFLYFQVNKVEADDFFDDVEKCNNVKTELRFACFRAAIDKHYSGKIEEFSEKIKSESPNFEVDKKKVDYAIFGTNCHTFWHAAGDFVAVYAPAGLTIPQKLALGKNSCTSGYMMGLYKRTALINGYSEKTIKNLFKSCGSFGLHQCAHEIGHILHDKYTYSILKVLDDVSAKNYGVNYPEKYRYVVAKKNDLNAPFEDCKKILPEAEWPYCFTGVGHNLFLFSEFSPDGYKGIFKECDNEVKKENIENCYAFLIYRIGINEAATKVISEDIEGGKKVCEDVIELSGYSDMRKHCYLGIGGGLGLFADSEFASYEPTEKNIPAARKRLTEFVNYCEKLDEEDIDSCLAGLFGTPYRKLYQKYQIRNERADRIFNQLDKDFQVVG